MRGLTKFFGISLVFFASTSAFSQALPKIPSAGELSPSDVGSKFYVEQAEGVRQPVIFVGFNSASVPIAFSLDAPQYRTTFAGTLAQCSAMGDGWAMPTVAELRLLTPYARTGLVTYLPGSSWSTSLAPCVGCKAPERYRLAYDVNSGNVRNSYDHDLFKFYPTCAFRVR